MSTQVQALRSQLDRYYGFLAQDQSNPRLRGQLADLHARLGELDEARKVLEEGICQWPDEAELKSRLASVAIAQNRPEEAIALLQGLQRNGADHPAIRYNLAYALLLLGRFGDTRDLLVTILDSPDVPKTPVLLARALHHLGKIEEAIQHLRPYLASHADDAEAVGLYALLNYDGGHSAVAKEAAEKTVKLDPEDHNALITLGSLALAAQDGERANAYFRRATQRYPKSGRAWSGRGLASMMAANLKRAVNDLEQAVQHMPNHVGSWHALAWCQIQLGDLTAARESFNKTMAIDDDFAETHGGLAVIAVLQNRLYEAQNLIGHALSIDPDSFAGLFAQTLLTAKFDRERAVEMLRDMLLSPAYPGGAPLLTVLTQVTSKRNTASQH